MRTFLELVDIIGKERGQALDFTKITHRGNIFVFRMGRHRAMVVFHGELDCFRPWADSPLIDEVERRPWVSRAFRRLVCRGGGERERALRSLGE